MSEPLHTRTRRRTPVHPGRILRRELQARQISQAELARLTNCPPPLINAIAQERRSVSIETARQLERVLQIPAHVWVNLQANHDQSISRLKIQQDLDAEAD